MNKEGTFGLSEIVITSLASNSLEVNWGGGGEANLVTKADCDVNLFTVEVRAPLLEVDLPAFPSLPKIFWPQIPT